MPHGSALLSVGVLFCDMWDAAVWALVVFEKINRFGTEIITVAFFIRRGFALTSQLHGTLELLSSSSQSSSWKSLEFLESRVNQESIKTHQQDKKSQRQNGGMRAGCTQVRTHTRHGCCAVDGGRQFSLLLV